MRHAISITSRRRGGRRGSSTSSRTRSGSGGWTHLWSCDEPA